ncbi:MAG: autotransporter-associated beta strand repeat-containing protein, partial [Kiritimatiellae bacterium]|nr:autotransporter-associated beta strand repeat-containing protein [Kiritimatiellia bacterium]
NISIFRVEGNVTTTTGTINIDDATIRILRQRTSLVEPPVIMNIKNRATFDIPADMTATIRTTVYDLTEGGAAEIVKTGGGTLFLTPNDGVSPSSLSSTIIVKEGQFTLGNANALVPNHGCTFKLEGGTISADYVGGASDILMHLDKSSVGNLMLHGNNAGENLDLSEFPGVALVPNGTFTYTGTITPYQNKYIFRPTGGLMVYDSDISDNANGVASVEIYGATDTDGVTLSGVNSGMTGNISVFKGILGISARSEAAGNSAFTKLYLAEGTSLKLDARLDDGFLTSRVDPASKPAAILLTDNSARCNVDLSLFPGCRLGTDKTDTIMVQTGAIFPNADNVYLLGGGAVPYYQTSHPGFQPSAMADTATGPARVEVGAVGIVNLSNSENTYSGGTSIVDGGAVFATADGFGAVPTEFDEDNIYINGGILRNANSNFALAATRGVKVGPDGAELHPWGTYSVDIRGGLTGAGPVRITDGGLITLSGANNTFQGPITVTQANQQLTIGSDEVFSWASTDGISTPGKVILKNGGNDTFNDVISGTGSLVKRGEGCMTLAQSQSYSGGTVVEGGALVLPDGVKLANSSSLFNNGEVVFSTLDALGLGIISGNGLFTVAGDVVLDTSRITGSQSFEVLDGAALDIDEPAFGEKSEVRLDDGARMTLGGCYVSKVDGFEAFSLNGSATLADGNLVLTPNTIGVSGSAFYPSQILISKPWSVSFTYQAGAHDEWTTDLLGAALVLQNDAAGPDALGAASSGAALGCTFAKSIGVIMRVGVESDTRNRYGFSNAGSITDDTSARSNAVAADGGNPIKITVSYDGSNLHAEWNCNGTVRTRDWTVDLAASLGSEFAWIGFTGATGASTGCEQTISNFAFGKSGATLSGINETDWTHSKYPATYTTLDDQPAFELTSNEGYKRSAVWNSTRINVTQPFRATFKYRVTACSTPPADGMAIAIQNYSSNAGDCYGADGGAVGLVYGTPRERTVGWAVNLYQGVNDQCFKYVLAGNFSGDTVPLTDWDLANGQDTEFTLTYDLYSLTLTATRNGVSISASRVVDLASAVGGDSAWIGFTGATGGSTARQVVYDFTFAYEEIDTSCYGNAFVVEGAAQMNLGEGTVAFGNLTLLDGADLAVGSAADSRLELAGTTLAGGATVTSSSAPIILSDTIAFDSATGILKLVGDVSASGKVALKLSSYNGSRDLIDLTEATTSLTEDDFEVTGDVSPLVKVGIRNGKVRVWRDDATIIILH